MQCNINVITWISIFSLSFFIVFFITCGFIVITGTVLGLWLACLPDVFFCVYTIQQFWYLTIMSLSDWLGGINLRLCRAQCVSLLFKGFVYSCMHSSLTTLSNLSERLPDLPGWKPQLPVFLSLWNLQRHPKEMELSWSLRAQLLQPTCIL